MGKFKIEELLSRVQAARALQVSPRTLREWAWKRQGPSYWKRGSRVFYAREDLKSWMEKTAVRVAFEGGGSK